MKCGIGTILQNIKNKYEHYYSPYINYIIFRYNYIVYTDEYNNSLWY